jgi:TonB family protein
VWAVQLWKKAIGPESLEAGLGTQRLAEVYRGVGDMERASAEYRGALRILETAKGPGHPALGGALRSYAEFLAALPNPAQAEPVLLRLLELKELQAGADSPILADDLGLYEKLLRRLNRASDAEKVAARRATLLETKRKQQPGSPAFRLPRILNRIEPQYTAMARTAKANASAKLAMIVDEQGNPQRIWVMSWAGLGLDENALEAVRQWKFEPAQRDGKPVLMHAVVEVNFRIL